MAHGHHHGHAHGVSAETAGDRRLLAGALVLILALMAGEVVAGAFAHSLALLADAGHMLTDAAALAMALGAAVMAERPPEGRWTWGFRRLEVLAAQVNGATLAVLAAFVVYSAVRRLVSPPDVHGGIVLGVGLAGVAVNLAATALLSRASRGVDQRPRGVPAHPYRPGGVRRQAVAGLLVLLTGWNRFDPIASLAVAALMFWAALGLLRESGGILLELSPRGLDPERGGAHDRAVEARRRGARPARLDGHERLRVAVGARARAARGRLPRRPPADRGGAARALRPRPHDAASRPRAAHHAGAD